MTERRLNGPPTGEVSRLLRFRSIALGLLVAVTLIAGAGALFKNSARNHDFGQRLCRAINEQNEKQIQLWEGIIRLASSNPQTTAQTPEQRAKQLAAFRELLAQTFRQQPC